MKADQEKRNTVLALVAAAACTSWMWLEGIVFHSSSPDVDVAQAKALIDDGALVIDVRGQEAFDHGHIPTALLVPLAELGTRLPDRLAGAEAKPIVVYCHDGSASGPAARAALARRGFKKVVNLKGGIQAWAAAGLARSSEVLDFK